MEHPDSAENGYVLAELELDSDPWKRNRSVC